MAIVALNGLFVGMIYALLAVGLVIVYRGSRVVTFAYGETGMIAAFVFSELRTGVHGQSLKPAADHGVLWPMLIAVGLAATIGALTEYFVVRPLRDQPRLTVMVATLAVGSLLLAIGLERWGTGTRSAAPLVQGSGINVGGLEITPSQLLIAAVIPAVLGALAMVYRFSSFGLRLRATAMDPYAAGLSGVNVQFTSMLTWAIAGGLAGLSAILIAPLFAFNVAFMTVFTVRAIAAALVGGLTSIGGAIVAALLLAQAEGFISYKTSVTGAVDLAVAAFILILLLARPQGLVRSAY